VIITDALASRLEYAEAVDGAGCVDAACRLNRDIGAAVAGVAGGVLTFCGVDSPLTHATGVGMNGPVTVEEVDAIEHFFLSRGAAVAIDVCPHSDPTLRDILSQRGYRITEFSNVVVRELPAGSLPETPESLVIRTAEPDEIELYATTTVRGFFGRNTMTEEEHTLGRMLFQMPCTTSLLAFLAGEAVGGGGVSMRNGVASFFGDATLRDSRGRGIQSGVIVERLRIASGAGCAIAVAGTQPGSVSQRNYQRLGFQVAYTRVTMLREG